MKILFLAQHKMPHIGGVEKHIDNLVGKITRKGHVVYIISEEDINYPHIKFIGLIFIWFWLFKNKNLILESDIVHAHDVFIWYLPFRFLYPNKRIYTTFHGWEGVWPIPWKNKFLKQLANRFSNGSIVVGKYVEKYYGITSDILTYGAMLMPRTIDTRKNIDEVVFVGRLNDDTGLLEFLKSIKNNHRYKIDFCGDGPLRNECEKYGTVHGFCDPEPFLRKAEYCVPGGYLAALEGLAHNCKLKLFWNNKVKEDYWKMSPFYKLKGEDLKKWAKEQTWEKLANQYLALYNEH